VNLVLERSSVTVATHVTDEEQLVDAVTRAGYGLEPIAEENVDRSEAKLRRDRREVTAASLLALPLVAQMLLQFMGYDELHLLPAFEVLLATPIQFVMGLRFYRAALNAVRSRSTNMDVLVVLGTTAAYVYSWYLLVTLGEAAEGQLFFEASAVVITLVLLGKYLEAKAKRATSEAVRTLMSLRPETALVKTAAGNLEERPIAGVSIGDVVVCRPGDRVAVDGRVIQGEAEVDESLITGESVPLLKSQGDTVTGGSININGMLEIETLAVGEDSALQTIVRLVESAQLGKARVQSLVDRITVWFVPLVLILAGITFAGWFLLYGDLEAALLAAVAVLVIACPCALGLATPTAIMTGTGAAARAGILIRDVSTLEEAQVLKRIVFDKTGTLTLGRPRVRQITTLAGTDELGVLEIAAAIQQNSEHPLARALCIAADERGISTRQSDGFVNRVGQGVEGRLDRFLGHDG
jgi:Cu+-exporting ATPase